MEKPKIEEKPAVKEAFRVQLGHGGWDISYPGRGTKVYGPNDIIELNPRDESELRAILSIVREINRRSTNAYFRVKDQRTGEAERVERFHVLSGMELLPEVLQKHSYSASGGYNPEEMEAIRKFCPAFQFEKKRPSPMMGTGM